MPRSRKRRNSKRSAPWPVVITETAGNPWDSWDDTRHGAPEAIPQGYGFQRCSEAAYANWEQVLGSR